MFRALLLVLCTGALACADRAANLADEMSALFAEGRRRLADSGELDETGRRSLLQGAFGDRLPSAALGPR